MSVSNRQRMIAIGTVAELGVYELMAGEGLDCPERVFILDAVPPDQRHHGQSPGVVRVGGILRPLARGGLRPDERRGQQQ